MESAALRIFSVLIFFFSAYVFGCGRVSSPVMPLSKSDSRKISETYPWQAALYKSNRSKDPRYTCGGTLIDHNKVITAAFCVAEPNAEHNLSVILGKVHNDLNIVESYQQIHQVDKIIIHEDYQGAKNNYQNAMAVLHLKENVTINNHVSPVCLDLESKTEKIQNGSLLHMAGYANDGKTSILTEELKEIPLIFLEQNVCQDLSKSLNNFLTPDKFCSLSTGGSSPGFGDSGHGIIIERDGHQYILGIFASQQTIGSITINTASYLDVAWLKNKLHNI